MPVPERDPREIIDDSLHDLLTPEEAAEVARKCASDPVWQAALAEAQLRLQQLQQLPPVEAPADLTARTLQRIERRAEQRAATSRSLIRSSLALVAASALLLVGTQCYFAFLRPSLYDLQVFGQSRLLAGSTGSLRVRFVRDADGMPMANVNVEVQLSQAAHGSGARRRNFVTLASFKTDAQGTGAPRFQLPELAEGHYDLRVVAQGSGGPEIIERSVFLERSWSLMLSSDRPVYQPGQTILVRGLALRRPDLKPVADLPLKYTIRDPKGNVIFVHSPKSSAFGLSSLECPLAVEAMEGPYRIACAIADTESELTVDVRKYVLPKFKIDVELDRPFYQPGQVVKGTVRANYFFGKPVSKGQVQVQVGLVDVEKHRLPPLATTTNENGVAKFSLTLPETLVGRPQDEGDARIWIDTLVQDAAGQKQVRTVERVVTARLLHVQAIPEGGQLVRNVPNRIYVITTYPDGRPAPCKLTVIGGAEKQLASSPLGITALERTPEKLDLRLTLRAEDELGQVGLNTVRLTCDNLQNDFLLRPDRAVYRGGETIHLNVIGSGNEPVFVDLLKDGQTLLTTTIDVKNGQGKHAIDLSPELTGTLELCAYRFRPDGLALRRTRVLFVHPPEALKLQAKFSQSEYRPGEQARVELTLQDATGRPAPGAISLAAVDEAVFSVLPQAPGLEQTFFNLEEKMLQPIYAIYPWSPDGPPAQPGPPGQPGQLGPVPPEWAQLEQAVFSNSSQVFLAPGEARSGDVSGMVEFKKPLDSGERGTGSGPRFSVGTGPHTLSATSHVENVRLTYRVRTQGMEWGAFGWAMWVLLGLALAYAVICYHFPYVGAGIACAGGLLMLMMFATMNLGTAMRADFMTVGAALGEMATAKSAPFGEMPNPSETGTAADDQAPPRLRKQFPETLLWRPQLITDERGQVSLDFELADSITSWRLTGSAVTKDGKLGSLRTDLKVFQPFFVDVNAPVTLTRGDEITLPVVVSNYLPEPQTVEVSLADATWFKLLDPSQAKIELAPGEVKSVGFRVKVETVGKHPLQITARSGQAADAVERMLEVVPDGRPVEVVFNGQLSAPAVHTLLIPEEVIPGSAQATLKVYPNTLSQVLEGVDGLFRQPYGCFEQTTSTTYPNVMALAYVKRVGKVSPEIEIKARQYVHLGYQRLLGFEVRGGGFSWYGSAPAVQNLTAYGLMQFRDMARVHDVDPHVLERTRDWLLRQRTAEGSWPVTGADNRVDGTPLGTTAFVAWAVFSDATPEERDRFEANLTRDYLLSQPLSTIESPYLLALVCNALLALGTDPDDVIPYLDRLEEMRKVSDDQKKSWWEVPQGEGSVFYASGVAQRIETTALVVLAKLRAKHQPGTIRAAIAWLLESKDGQGIWYSTQATVLSLKALLAFDAATGLNTQPREITYAVADRNPQKIELAPDLAEVLQQVNFSQELLPGIQELKLEDKSDLGTAYQVVLRYYLPEALVPQQPEALTLKLAYDRTDLAVNDLVSATLQVTNNLPEAAPMVLLDLPIPAGFALEFKELDDLAAQQVIDRYQVNPRTAIVYLRQLPPGQTWTLRYRLRATLPVRLTVPAAQAYHYYDPTRRGRGPTLQVTVRPAATMQARAELAPRTLNRGQGS